MGKIHRHYLYLVSKACAHGRQTTPPCCVSCQDFLPNLLYGGNIVYPTRACEDQEQVARTAIA